MWTGFSDTDFSQQLMAMLMLGVYRSCLMVALCHMQEDLGNHFLENGCAFDGPLAGFETCNSGGTYVRGVVNRSKYNALTRGCVNIDQYHCVVEFGCASAASKLRASLNYDVSILHIS
jgi:hypothetical protein